MIYLLLSVLGTHVTGILVSKISFTNNLPMMEMQIGTPPQKEKFILDTGSYRTIMPCYKIQNDNETRFDLQKSNSTTMIDCSANIGLFKCESCNDKEQCTFSQNYADGTNVSGYFVQENVRVGEYVIDNLTFGCIDQVYKKSKYLGVSMMGLQELNDDYFPNLVDVASDQDNRSFSLCFNQSDGYMIIGFQSSNPKVKVPYTSGLWMTQYQITIKNIISPGFEFNKTYFNNQQVILDSGSNYITTSDKTLLQAFHTHFKSNIQGNLTVYDAANLVCVLQQGSLETFFKNLPTYVFELDNKVQIKLEPQNYMRQSLLKSLYCFPVTYLETSYGVILGTAFMNGMEVTFDQTNRLVHFSESCSHKSILKDLSARQITKNNTAKDTSNQTLQIQQIEVGNNTNNQSTTYNISELQNYTSKNSTTENIEYKVKDQEIQSTQNDNVIMIIQLIRLVIVLIVLVLILIFSLVFFYCKFHRKQLQQHDQRQPVNIISEMPYQSPQLDLENTV